MRVEDTLCQPQKHSGGDYKAQWLRLAHYLNAGLICCNARSCDCVLCVSARAHPFACAVRQCMCPSCMHQCMCPFICVHKSTLVCAVCLYIARVLLSVCALPFMCNMQASGGCRYDSAFKLPAGRANLLFIRYVYVYFQVRARRLHPCW